MPSVEGKMKKIRGGSRVATFYPTSPRLSLLNSYCTATGLACSLPPSGVTANDSQVSILNENARFY